MPDLTGRGGFLRGVFMNLSELKDAARRLPESPGVYIMFDNNDDVIYVGKAKKLKNRVSQYFQDSASHTAKTRKMVSHIDHFEVIIAATEFEALVLECSLIKQHMPKYNILLKDDKGYPYIRLTVKEEYPEISVVSKPSKDGSEYFGPYGSRGITNHAVEVIREALRLPDCKRKFPRDIGKQRPCLNYHIKRCEGWCTGNPDATEYRNTIDRVRQILSGNFTGVMNELQQKMTDASESLNFELAAYLRDQIHAVSALKQKQFVTANASIDMDAIAYVQTDVRACFVVLHFSSGNLVDKEFELFTLNEEPARAVSAILKQYYDHCGFKPKVILLPFDIEDRVLIAEYLSDQFSKKVTLSIPVRGERKKLVSLAEKNAYDEIQRITTKEERRNATLTTLSEMLGIDSAARIEAYDISNISGTDVVASMVVFQDGAPKKSAYRSFKIKNMPNQDDYASMHQVITRRFQHYINQDAGFESIPDLLLIDGGVGHAVTALRALQELGVDVPVFGMVKDDRHRTRALVTPEGKEIGISNRQNIFTLIGNIQEEVHRFAISYHRKLRSKRLSYSELDAIKGVGAKRKQELLKAFKSLTAIRSATLEELIRVVPKNVATSVYQFYHKE